MIDNNSSVSLNYSMNVYYDAPTINQYLKELSNKGISTGFVPTMGALHDGHVSLINRAKQEVDQVICSIFVNPLQFNRKEDLENYPNRVKEDTAILEKAECDILFLPDYETMYPKSPDLSFNFGSIAKGMEAKYRPQHFEGVAAVIKRFFEILSPDKAYFGEKDFQQLAIIRWLRDAYNFKTEIVGCKTLRAKNGLALSSRNYLLTEKDLKKAAFIYKTMSFAKENIANYSPEDLVDICNNKLTKEAFQVDYFSIVDEKTLQEISNWSETESPRVFVAAYLSGVRLIDNISLIH